MSQLHLWIGQECPHCGHQIDEGEPYAFEEEEGRVVHAECC